eukprot:TRINITY_DN57200_c0_g1_i1.p1 TRINITY_DN57200_c0_g1~~TRINITY_DN57200_c0_g1_i1.p1  ORF type:complete len:236 (-),score=17.94 TRINITY_DN57200_c0_g1_i1:129-773(-)
MSRVSLCSALCVCVCACSTTWGYRLRQDQKEELASLCGSINYFAWPQDYGWNIGQLQYLKYVADKEPTFDHRLDDEEEGKYSQYFVLVPNRTSNYYLAIKNSTDKCLTFSQVSAEEKVTKQLEDDDGYYNESVIHLKPDVKFKHISEDDQQSDCINFKMFDTRLETTQREGVFDKPYYVKKGSSRDDYGLRFTDLKGKSKDFHFYNTCDKPPYK